MRNTVFLQDVEVNSLPFQVFNDSVIPFSMTVGLDLFGCFFFFF